MVKTTKQDLLLAVRKASFVTPGAFELHGRMGETRLGGMQNATVCRQLLDSTMVRTTLAGVLGGSALNVKAQVVDFRDYPVVTIDFEVENPNADEVKLDMLSILRREFCGSDPVIVGEDGTEYEVPNPPPPKERPPHPPVPGQHPPHPHFPHFDQNRYFLRFEECTVMVACESGMMFRKEPCGVTVMIGKQDLSIPAGETVGMPRITLVVTEGDDQRCEALYRAWTEAHF